MKHILIVDDDIHINKMLDEVLVHERYMVSHAYSGTEALLFLADTKPDLILLDLMLPGLSGEELLPQISDIPIIVMSAKVDVLSVTFASLFTLVAMLSQNKAIIAVACILFSFGLLFAGAMCNRMLDAPKTIPAYSIGENGENTAQEMENPKYLDGTKREIVQFIYDVNPGGQAIQCSTMQVVNLTRLPIYSLVIVILTTGAGVWIFKKKDLK